jgi:uncharacterized protein
MIREWDVLEKYLTYEDMVEICRKINERYLPDDEVFMEAVDDLLEQYNGEGPKQFMLKVFKHLLKLVDSQIQQIEQKVQVRPTCDKGCAYCCYFPIITTKLEAKLIMAYIDSLPAKKHEEILKHLAAYFQANQKKLQKMCSIDFDEDVQFKEKYIAGQLPCPFLDLQTNTCKVYEVRPVPCRTYLNYCNPNVCAQSYIPDEPFSYEFFYDYYMQALNELIQELLYNEDEELGFDYPDDMFTFDYLPNFLRQVLKR